MITFSLNEQMLAFSEVRLRSSMSSLLQVLIWSHGSLFLRSCSRSSGMIVNSCYLNMACKLLSRSSGDNPSKNRLQVWLYVSLSLSIGILGQV